jgi:GNAT superfamily N-acetyltransferase
MPASVRAARLEDAEVCASITATGRDAEAFRAAFSTDNEAWVVLVAEDGSVFGVAGCQLWRWNRVAWVMDLSIQRDRRGHGQGRVLLEAMLEAAKRNGALVLMDFEPQGGQLIEFYLQNGFRICGFNDRFLPGTDDPSAVFLARDL